MSPLADATGSDQRNSSVTWERRRVPRPEACLLVREAMGGTVGLLPVVEAAAQAVRELVGATSVRISLLDRDHYLDLVNVGVFSPDEKSHPGRGWYPTSHYPAAAKRLLTGEVYFSSNLSDPLVTEYQHVWTQYSIKAVMGVPIISLMRVVGQVFVMRDAQLPSPFSHFDVQVATEAAMTLGVRLPALLASYIGAHPGAQPEPLRSGEQLPTSGLAKSLTDLMRTS